MASLSKRKSDRHAADFRDDHDTSLAKVLAPEEIRVGDFVTILQEVTELPSFLWCGEPEFLARDEPVRLRHLSVMGGVPLRVKSVCLPFVLVRHPCAFTHTLDVRKHRLARLSIRYAKSAWRLLKSQN